MKMNRAGIGKILKYKVADLVVFGSNVELASIQDTPEKIQWE
jgi:hypothetical protein